MTLDETGVAGAPENWRWKVVRQLEGRDATLEAAVLSVGLFCRTEASD